MNAKEAKSRTDYIWATLTGLYVVAIAASDWRSGWTLFSGSSRLFSISCVFFTLWLVFRRHWQHDLWLRIAAYTAFLGSHICRVLEGKLAPFYLIMIVVFLIQIASDVRTIRRRAVQARVKATNTFLF